MPPEKPGNRLRAPPKRLAQDPSGHYEPRRRNASQGRQLRTMTPIIARTRRGRSGLPAERSASDAAASPARPAAARAGRKRKPARKMRDGPREWCPGLPRPGAGSPSEMEGPVASRPAEPESMNVFMAAILQTGDFISNRPPMAPWNQGGGAQAWPAQFVTALKDRCNAARRSLPPRRPDRTCRQ